MLWRQKAAFRGYLSPIIPSGGNLDCVAQKWADGDADRVCLKELDVGGCLCPGETAGCVSACAVFRV